MILIVEDNKDVNALLKEALTNAGYDTNSVFDGNQAIDAVETSDFELILLDMMLPYKSGDEVLKVVREKSDTPVIVLSAKGMTNVKVDMLKLGADDYVTKPFEIDELLARVATNLRRSRGSINKNKVIQYKNMFVDCDGKKVTINDIELDCTAKEFKIIQMLLENQGKVFTKAALYEAIWEEAYLGDDNAIKTHISNLRSKIRKLSGDEEYIETVWGLGYRINKL